MTFFKVSAVKEERGLDYPFQRASASLSVRFNLKRI